MTDPKNDAYVDDLVMGLTDAQERIREVHAGREEAAAWAHRVESNIRNSGALGDIEIENHGRALTLKRKAFENREIVIRCGGQQLFLFKVVPGKDREETEIASCVVEDERDVRNFFRHVGVQVEYLKNGGEWA